MKFQPKIYLETTVFNYYFLRDPTRQVNIDATRKLFKEIKAKRWHAFTSAEVVRELRKSKEPLKSKMFNLIKSSQIFLLTQKQLKGYLSLTNLYIKRGAIPKSKRADARHIAIATVSKMDILVSWNQRHIVRYKTQEIVRKINISSGFKIISINTPSEVISYERE